MPRKMRQSGVDWIGEIPEGWTCRAIKSLALAKSSLFADGDWINSVDVSTSGIRYFTTGNVGQGVFKEQGNGYITQDTFNRLGCLEVHGGDLVISRLNEPIGRACLIPDSYQRCVVAVDCVVVRPDPEFDKKFLVYAMSSDRYAEQGLLLARGTTMQRISRTQLGSIKLPIPPLPVQRNIVQFLDSRCEELDGIITTSKAVIEDYKVLKQSIIFEAVTGRLNVAARVRNDGVLAVGAVRGTTAGTPSLRSSGVDWLGDIPAAWDVVPVKYLLTEVNSRSESGTEEPLSMSQVLGIVPSSMINVANPAASFIGAKKVSPGDLVFNKLKAHLGVFAVSSYEGLVSPDYAVYRSTSLSDVGYLSYLFHSTNCIDEFRRHVRGVGQGLSRLYSSDLFAIKVPLPPLEEQKRIADMLDEKCGEIDAVVADKERLIADLETYKKSLIFEVVTGKREVA